MGSQPNLASRSEVVSIYKCLTKISGGSSPKIYGAKTSKFWTTFSAISALDTAYLRNKMSHGPTKMLCQSTTCPLQGDLLVVTFDPETAEIRLLIVTEHSAAITLQSSKLRHFNFFYNSAGCSSLCLNGH